MRSLLPLLLLAGLVRAQWMQMGPSGGSSMPYAIGTEVFAATNGGLWRSSNNGATWVFAAPGFVPTSMEAAGSDLFATGYVLYTNTNNRGVFRSMDRGTTWSYLLGGLPRADSSALLGTTALLFYGRYLFAGTAVGIFRSADSGLSWTRMNSGLTYSNPPLTPQVSSLAISGPYLIVGTNAGIFRSTDSAANWAYTSRFLNTASVSSLMVMGDSLIFGGSNSGIYRSADTGMTWAEITDLPHAPVTPIRSGVRLYIGIDSLIYSSSDRGVSWVQAGNIANLFSSLAAKGDTLFAGTNSAGLLRSIDGGSTWNDAGISAADISTLAVSGGELWAGGRFADGILQRTPDFGASWIPVNTGLNYRNPAYCMTANGNGIFVGTVRAGILYSSDRGSTWNPAGFNLAWIFSLAANNNYVFAGLGGNLYRTADNGATWDTAINTGSQANAIVVSGSAAFAATGFGLVVRSSDSGRSWMRAGVFADASFTSLAALGPYVFGGMDSISTGEWAGIFRSSDSGATWTQVNNGLTRTQVRTLAVSGTALFAGAYGGLSVSTDSGSSWIDVTNGLLTPDIRALAVQGPYLFVGTYGGSVWRRPLAEMIPTSIRPSSRETGAELRLIRGLPGPQIEFTLVKRGWVELAIYDMSGRKTAILARGMLDAGRHHALLNGKHKPGLYFARLRAEGFNRTQRFVLER